MIVDITYNDDRWKEFPFEAIAKRVFILIQDTILQEKKCFEISILVSNDEEIRHLNKNFRGFNQSTNVLAWPQYEYRISRPGDFPERISILTDHLDGSFCLGDLAISYDTCLHESQVTNIKFEDHVTHLLIHGGLHLIGFNHETERDALRMQEIEIRVLSKMGIGCPYESNVLRINEYEWFA